MSTACGLSFLSWRDTIWGGAGIVELAGVVFVKGRSVYSLHLRRFVPAP